MADQLSPHVSVIIPVYKTPLDYFKECIVSLCNQTMRDAEFIIVFDGENEELQSICDFYQKKDPRFKIFNQPHLGVSATRNFGIEKSEGEYITFVDADDWIESDCCQTAYTYAKEYSSDIVLFDYNAVDNQYQNKKYWKQSIVSLSTNQIEELLQQTIYLTDEKNIAAVSTWCKLINKNLIIDNNIRFSSDVKICVDRPFSFSLYLHAKKISYLNKTFYNYNKVASSITWAPQKDRAMLMLAHLTAIKKSTEKYHDLIGKHAILIFLGSWENEFFNESNKDSLFTTIKKIYKNANSKEFRRLITDINTTGMSKSIALETFLIKHNILFHIWLHALKWKFLTFFRKRFHKV